MLARAPEYVPTGQEIQAIPPSQAPTPFVVEVEGEENLPAVHAEQTVAPFVLVIVPPGQSIQYRAFDLTPVVVNVDEGGEEPV